MAPAHASAYVPVTHPPRRWLLRIAGLLTQLLAAGCLLLGTIAFVLVQQNKTGGAGLVGVWAFGALIGLVFGGLMGRGGLISLVLCAMLDITFGVVLLTLDPEALRSLLRVLPASDVEAIGGVLTAAGGAQLAAFVLCLLAIPQALRYTRWMHAETEPRLASSTARGFPPPPVSAAHGSVWQMPLVAPEESRSRRRLYFALAGFAVGFGAGIGVLVSSSSPSRPVGAAAVPTKGSAVRPGSGGAPEQPAAGVAEVGSGSGGSGGSAGVSIDANARGSNTPDAPGAAGQAPASIGDLVQAQRAALVAGDLTALARMLSPTAFGFGIDADEAGVGRIALEQMLRKDLGALVEGGAKVDVRYQASGDAHDHAWLAFELEIAPKKRGLTGARRFAVTQLAAWIDGAWQIVAWHWATPVLDETAERMAVLGTKPAPKPIESVVDGPAALGAAVRAAFGSRKSFAAARSEHAKGFNFGSGKGERIVGGAAVKKVFGRLRADLRLHDGVHVAAAGSWDPAQKAAPQVAFAAANVDFTTKTKAATSLTHTFRVLAVLLFEDGDWKIVQTQWSHGGPVR